MKEAVGFLLKALRLWGVDQNGEYNIKGLQATLDFHRGGAPSQLVLPKRLVTEYT